MSKRFRPWKIDEPQLLPASVQDFVAEDHLARFVVSLVTEELDLVEITASYLGEKGQPPFDPEKTGGKNSRRKGGAGSGSQGGGCGQSQSRG